jgi:hypothetical protein
VGAVGMVDQLGHVLLGEMGGYGTLVKILVLLEGKCV